MFVWACVGVSSKANSRPGDVRLTGGPPSYQVRGGVCEALIATGRRLWLQAVRCHAAAPTRAVRPALGARKRLTTNLVPPDAGQAVRCDREL